MAKVGEVAKVEGTQVEQGAPVDRGAQVDQGAPVEQGAPVDRGAPVEQGPKIIQMKGMIKGTQAIAELVPLEAVYSLFDFFGDGRVARPSRRCQGRDANTPNFCSCHR